MFYEKSLENVFRFGDVIKSFVFFSPEIVKLKKMEFNFKISIPQFCVVLSPCCSISDGLLTLTPLKEVHSKFFKNPNFVKNLDLINIKIDAEKAIPPNEWNNLKQEDKQIKSSGGLSYAWVELFIYKGNDALPYYKIKSHEINDYMIDFRKIIHVKCELTDEEIVSSTKCLQLTTNTRIQLRDKIAGYYSRVENGQNIL